MSARTGLFYVASRTVAFSYVGACMALVLAGFTWAAATRALTDEHHSANETAGDRYGDQVTDSLNRHSDLFPLINYRLHRTVAGAGQAALRAGNHLQ